MSWKRLPAVLASVLAAANAFGAVVLPKPTYANSIIISLEHLPTDADELAYIKANFPFGLYAWPSVSVTHVDPDLAWTSDWSEDGADTGIEAFKTTVESYIAAAAAAGFKLHLVLCSGLARGRGIYLEAKTEDVRNAQWYDDNNIVEKAEHLASSADVSKYVFGTFSRYARKLRANLEAKSRAAYAFLKQQMIEHPGTLILVSGWGEAEMNDWRIKDEEAGRLISSLCDYSPFAVLEFRDWIQHAGEYDDSTGKYKGQGWAQGGTKYQGEAGLDAFNSDFGKDFSTWNLKYFNWQLTDGWDTGRIPLANYIQGGMMPGSEKPGFTDGGFDPPRTKNPGGKFWDLWNLFRETLVHHLVQDAARWAADAGIPADRWYSHQIPADYLFGTQPSGGRLDRYDTSASPLWTAGIAPLGSTGASIYDAMNGEGLIFRTTDHVFPAISAMSGNWAIMEYDAETYPKEGSFEQSPVDEILAQYLRAYSYKPHLINFWRWQGESDHRIKGMHKEAALRAFIGRIRDKARSTDPGLVFAPPQVTGLSGSYGPAGAASLPAAASPELAGPSGLACAARLTLTGKIWPDAAWTWKEWGDFDRFEIYRGPKEKFAADKAHLIGETPDYVFEDQTIPYGSVFYYKVRAVNRAGVKSAPSAAVMVSATVTTGPLLALSRAALLFGASAAGGTTPAQTVVVTNAGAAGTTVNWTAVSDRAWLSVSPASGTGAGLLSIAVNAAGLAPGKYEGTVSVDDPQAANGPLIIAVVFKIKAAAKNAAPIGKISTPLNRAMVEGCIAVSGWALDDVAVNRVVVKRFPAASDTDGDIDDDGLVTLGEAALIRGARPDIEKKYAKKYPLADRAGWGYTLVTNLLPNNGNGVFKITAVAVDTGGKTKRLGTRRITVDNAGAVKPFGAIDAPAMGEKISGGAYVQTGWALTPQPDSIKTDGSDITVLVDGAAAGHPRYNLERSDIAELFPGYANSGGSDDYLGPGGEFILDTTALSNTTHTIVWNVKETGAGSVEYISVIGPYYFDVLNIGSSTARVSPAVAGGWPEAAALPEVFEPALRIKALEAAAAQIDELGRVDLFFAVPSGARLIGWGGEPDKPLPVGSTLDAGGRFRWLAGPGFLGRHVLHFAATDGFVRGPAVEIAVNIVPRGGVFIEGD